MIELRKYQHDSADNVLVFFKKGGKHVLVQAPTGSGKTIVFSYIANNATRKNKKVLILTNRHELLMQTGGALSQFNLSPFYIQAGAKFINFNCNIYVAMIMTLKNRMKLSMWRNWIKNDIDLIIVDEAHLQDFNSMFEDDILKDKYVIGFTATPQRTGKMRQLALDYEEIIESVSVSELVQMGYLVSDDYYGVASANLNNIKYDYAKGDYSESDMFNRFNSPKLYAGVVKNWLEIASNTHTLVFCVNIEHTIHTCEEFRKNGIDAQFIVSKMSSPKEPEKTDEGAWVRYEEKMRLYQLYRQKFGQWSGERGLIINNFKRKRFPVLINANMLTTGFDCPEIETIIANRATTSVTLWLQMIGRGARISPGKTHFNILDFGENADRLGHYTSPRGWGLWHKPTNEGGIPPVKECGIDNKGRKITGCNKEGCMRLILAAYTICPFCGFMYPKKKIKEVDLQTLAYDTEEFRAIAVKKISEMDVDELHKYFKIKKHKPPWLWRQLYFRGGVSLIKEFGKSKSWRNGTIEAAVNYANSLE